MPKMEHIRKIQLLEANEEEQKGIKKLEKALKLKKRKRKNKSVKSADGHKEKIHNMFKDDGLDYILGALDIKKKELICSDLSNDEELVEDLSVATGTNNTFKVSKKPDKLISSSKKRKNTLAKDNNNGCEDIENDKDSDTIDEPVSTKRKCAKKPKIWEDIYGRLRDEDGNVIENDNNKQQTYIPPAKRLKLEGGNEEKKAALLKLQRQLKGLLNRLSESNMQPISSQIEQMYMKNSRNDMNETLMFLMSELVLSSILTPPRLILEQAMLITLLHAVVGSEVGAYFLQCLATKLHQLFQLDDNYGPGKQSNNLLIFLSHLYNFKVTHCTLIFDILKCLINSFKDKDIELIQVVMRTVGFSLRKDNPLKMKEIINLIQKKAPTFQSKENSSRVQFMLDTLTAIRNNNMYKIAEYDPTIIEHMKKVLRGLLKQGSAVQELAISFEDLLKAEEKGRWWIVGSAWSERTSDNIDESSTTPKGLPHFDVNEKILELARKQHMNTEIRKTIFCIIMTAEDYMDAFEKLLRVNLKQQQEREIINVILHCVLNEKKFNPYYAFLAGKFCKFSRKYYMNLQFTLWDKFKELQNMKSHNVNNLACFLSHLFIKGDVPISVLKVIHFSEMNKTMVRFFRQTLVAVLLHENEEACSDVFKRIAPAKNLNLLREGLRLFMHHFLLRNTSKFDPSVIQKLEQRIKMAENALNCAKRAFKL